MNRWKQHEKHLTDAMKLTKEEYKHEWNVYMSLWKAKYPYHVKFVIAKPLLGLEAKVDKVLANDYCLSNAGFCCQTKEDALKVGFLFGDRYNEAVRTRRWNDI